MLFFYIVISAITSAIGQSPETPRTAIVMPNAYLVRSFQGEVFIRKHGVLTGASGVTISEYMINGKLLLASATTDQNGHFQLPDPTDSNPRMLIVSDTAGHLVMSHVQLSSTGGRLRFRLAQAHDK